jgi:hypothetical protein
VGTLKYDGVTVEFDDRVLAHIEVVVVQKLRRGEPFLMSWRAASDAGGGRTAIWIQPAAMLSFHFVTNDNPEIERAWLERLITSANSATGMFVTDAEGDTAHPSDSSLDG